MVVELGTRLPLLVDSNVNRLLTCLAVYLEITTVPLPAHFFLISVSLDWFVVLVYWLDTYYFLKLYPVAPFFFFTQARFDWLVSQMIFWLFLGLINGLKVPMFDGFSLLSRLLWPPPLPFCNYKTMRRVTTGNPLLDNDCKPGQTTSNKIRNIREHCPIQNSRCIRKCLDFSSAANGQQTVLWLFVLRKTSNLSSGKTHH